MSRFASHLGRAMLPAVLLAGAISAPAWATTWKTVRIATEGAYPPWNMSTPGGKIIGFEPDLVTYLCAHMKVKCVLIAQDWNGVIPGLTAGKYDAIMDGMAITAQREKVISFSVPYAQTPSEFAVLKSSPLATSLPDKGVRLDLTKHPKAAMAEIAKLRTLLKGKTIGVQVSTIQAAFLNKYFKNDVTIRTYPTTQERDLDLQAGRVDVILDSLGYLMPAMGKPTLKDAVLTGPVYAGGVFGMGTGVGLRKGNPHLRAMFSSAIKSALADGTIHKLALKWFHFDVTPK